MLLIDATPTLERSLDRIEVGIVNAPQPDKTRWLRGAPAGESEVTLPFTLSVAPREHESRTLVIRGFTGESVRTERLVKVTFREGKVLLLPVYLSEECANFTCENGNTCVDCGACAPLAVDLDALSVVANEKEAIIGWKAPICDPHATDGGLDASPSPMPAEAGMDAQIMSDAGDAASPDVPDAGGILTVTGPQAVAKTGCYAVTIAQVGELEIAVAASGASLFSDSACSKKLSDGSKSSQGQREVYVALAPPTTQAEPNVRRVSVTASAGADSVSHVIEVRKPAKHIMRGDSATCVQLVDDTVQCVGTNDYGLTGQPNTGFAAFSEPHDVPALAFAFTTLSARAFTGCAVVNGGARCWGLDGAGQVGDGGDADGNADTEEDGIGHFNGTPSAVVGLGTGVTAIEVASEHACAVQDSKVYCWGRNDDGRVIDSATGRFDVPKQRGDLAGFALDVGVSDDRSCAVMMSDASFTSGSVRCWRGVPSTLTNMDLGGAAAVEVDGLGEGMCARTSGQGIYCWGNCGVGECASALPTPVALPVSVDLAALRGLATARAQACTWTDEEVYCWGLNSEGRLGGGTTEKLSPAVKALLPEGHVTEVAAGGDGGRNATCAIVDGLVYCWGFHLSGEIGTSALVGDLLTPTPTPLLDSLDADAAYLAQWYYSPQAISAASTNGAAFVWGRSNVGLGGVDGELESTIVPRPLTTLMEGVDKLEFGAAWTVAQVDGQAMTWGLRDSFLGRPLGGPEDPLASVPSALTFPSPGRVIDITAGHSHGCALLSTGDGGGGTRLYCWGAGSYGQLGLSGDVYNGVEVPTLVLDETARITDVAADYAATCVVADGGLLCWGFFNGEPLPTPVPGMSSGLEQVEISDEQICARTTQGSVKCVPLRGTTVTTLSIGKPAEKVQIVDIQAGVRHLCGLGDNGKLYCWGTNANGQLGAGDRAEHAGAVEVQGLVGRVTSFAVGYDLGVSCAKDSEGWKCWGNNGMRAMGLEPFVQATPRLMLPWED